jgi:hypothetical protein
MEKIVDGFLYTLGSTLLLVPIFYYSARQLMKYKTEIVASSMDQFSSKLFGNFMGAKTVMNENKRPTPPPFTNTKKGSDSDITNFFIKKRGIIN